MGKIWLGSGLGLGFCLHELLHLNPLYGPQIRNPHFTCGSANQQQSVKLCTDQLAVWTVCKLTNTPKLELMETGVNYHCKCDFKKILCQRVDYSLPVAQSVSFLWFTV